MNLADISYLTFSHNILHLPSITTALKCKYNHVTSWGGGHNFQQFPTIYTIEAWLPLEPHFRLLSVPALHAPYWPGWLNFPSKHLQSSSLRYPTRTFYSTDPKLKLCSSLSVNPILQFLRPKTSESFWTFFFLFFFFLQLIISASRDPNGRTPWQSVVRTLRFYGKAHRFDLWLRN